MRYIPLLGTHCKLCQVTIQPPWVRKYRQSDKKLYHSAIAAWKKLCPAVKGEQHSWVFDGHNILYSTKKRQESEFQKIAVKVYSEEDEKEVDLLVKDIVRVMDINVNQVLRWKLDLDFNAFNWLALVAVPLHLK